MKLFRGIRRKFITIYLLLGLAPLLAISYLSFKTSADTLERISSQQLSNLAAKTANQTSQLLNVIRKDQELLSNYPFIQLAFLQFNFGQRLETVYLKLQKYKSQNPLYSRISLISLQGDLILSIPAEDGTVGKAHIDPNRLRNAISEDQYSSGVLPDHPEGPLIIFSKRVYDFENISEPVGLLVFYVPLESLTRFVEELDPVPGALGFVFDRTLGQVLGNQTLPLDPRPFLDASHGEGEVRIVHPKNYRLFLADIPDVQWTMGLFLPEKSLLGDISALRVRTLSFALTIAALALGITLFFVRRITDPIAQLTRGAQEFSTGHLDHRIAIHGEGELRRLGEEFNAMAGKLKERERQIRQVDRFASLGILAAGIAHEVRNPLAGMKSCAQLMQRKAIAPEIGVLAGGINEEIDRLDKIVRGLLDFARPGEASPVWMSPAEVLERVLAMTRKTLEEMGISIRTDFPPVSNVWADPDQVRQIFLNLVLNAAHAMQEGGALELTIREDKGQVAAVIADNGCGIPREHLDRIFDPFFSLSPGGTGLGLSVAHTLMQENRINFRLDSAPGQGTRFELFFVSEMDGTEELWQPS